MPSTLFFYILKCSDRSFYIGSTTNIKNRVKTHNQGKGTTYTAKRRPVHLVYHEKHSNLDDAMKRERQVKGWTRVKKEALINNDLETLRELSKSK